MVDANFRQELTFLVVDKFFIGLVVLLVGFFVKRALEHYRTNQAIREAVK